jgi:type VI secretion system protein ImpC
MSKPISFGKLDFKVVASMEEPRSKPEPEAPFRVAILGDFSGRESRGTVDRSLANRKPLRVDRDNLDKVMGKLGVKIDLPILGKSSPPIRLKFCELDDFHPDRLFERLDLFESLRDMRQGLKDPSTFAALTKELETGRETGSLSAPEDMERSLAKIAGEKTGGLLDQVLEETQGKPLDTESDRGTSEWDSFLKQMVKPHVRPNMERQQAEMLASVDAATNELMRRIVHHPVFQGIEAAWRVVHFLVSKLETDTQVHVYLFDMSKEELAADLRGEEDLRATGAYKLLVEQTVETPGGEPWAVVAGDFIFDHTREDVELLGRLAKICSQAGAPFLAMAHPRLLGCQSLVEAPDPRDWHRSPDAGSREAWKMLRRLPEVVYVGLALPRFLLRLPYGAETDPIEQFDFEEMGAMPEHDHYLWGNPSFACVCLLAQSFSQSGWDLWPGSIQDIEGLPLHVYKVGGESQITPCAELVLTERGAEAILDKGLMPLLSFRNQDTVRLARFQSLAHPPLPLAGRWSE